ncbi:LysE family translocator [Roseomonas marmotae]|uniref:LysE family translocator n=1 Tax=Roseomonas marmotae TaxID=2768161 RepID=A0ABS3K921_9PROT|nr:LysE family translocator [Roseomonas marmotae]MBO1073128.1 LysE family translocator [Roseomonas marmotae]QTI79236.1 LysE family translocator [Roseomonas marmotae]
MSPTLLSLTAFVAAASVFTVTPGMDTALVLRTSGASGARAGLAAAGGICLGLLVWGVGAAFGLTALLAASALGFAIVTWAGAAYLVWLGLKLLARPRVLVAEGPHRAAPGAREGFRNGLLTNLLNPKVGVFYVTSLPQFIPQGTGVAGFSLLLALVHVALTLAWFSLLVGMTVPLGRFLSQPGVVRWLDRLTGCVFLGFGLKLALAQRG